MSDWHPVGDRIKTRWANQVDPNCPLPEYPRPQLTRLQWMNLNGLWEYAICPRELGFEQIRDFKGKILVPFAIESSLSGVAVPLLPDQRLWYRRTFRMPDEWKGKIIRLHFGAVDWETNVFCNGIWLGSHQGGYDPFHFDLQDSLTETGENELLISVWDPTNEGLQERGKQTLKPGFVFYSAVSGIWQTVWLEPLPTCFIERVLCQSDINTGTVHLKIETNLNDPQLSSQITILDEGRIVAEVKSTTLQDISVPIPSARLWSPDEPNLYQLNITLLIDGKEVDLVGSYFAFREISLHKDAHGIQQIHLNGKKLFQYGALDQGYWPDGLYTAPTDEALVFDIHTSKKLGLNMLRKHIKVEPARWYYHCDRLGMLVWQDMPCGGKIPDWLIMGWGAWLNAPLKDDHAYHRFGRENEDVRCNYWRELQAMVDGLNHFPSIVVWVPFNEAWGQFNAREVGEWLQSYDHTRLVDAASGWFDQGSGDIHSIHVYVGPKMPAKERERALALSEFGGLGYKINGHLWQEKKLFAYRMVKDEKHLTTWYLSLMEQLLHLKRKGLCAAIYTELTDVEYEINGFMTYDRDVLKMDPERISEAHRKLIADNELL